MRTQERCWKKRVSKQEGFRKVENTKKKLQIGNVVLDNPLILAPMAGVTDLPFRLLCREQGAGLVCMEMVSAKAIYFGNKNTEELMKIRLRDPYPCSYSAPTRILSARWQKG